jgi:hypothetical protein
VQIGRFFYAREFAAQRIVLIKKVCQTISSFKGFCMTRCLALLGLLAISMVGNAWAQGRQLIPTSYEDGRFVATPHVDGTNTLRLLVDTAGPSYFGLYELSDKAIKRFNLPVAPCNVSGATVSLVKPFYRTSGLPTVAGSPCHSVAIAQSHYDATHWDGCIGDGYLMHFIWTFDYPAKQLWREPDNWKPSAAMHATKLGFLKDAKGESLWGSPRITLIVDGQPLDMKLQTGAPRFLIRLAGNTQALPSGSSYLTKSTIDQLLLNHPDCCEVMLGGRGIRVIKILKLEVAGWIVGPVWFAEAPDALFPAGPGGGAKYMDKQVYGAAGSNIFDHFSMTLDYRTDTAWFACASGCSSAGK